MAVDPSQVRGRLLSVVVAVGVGLASAPQGAAASRLEKEERRRAVVSELRTLRQQVSEASQQEAALLDRLDEVEGRRRQLDGRVADLDRQVAVVGAEAQAAEVLLEAMQGDFVRTQTKLALARDRLAAERNELRERAVAAYMGDLSANHTEVLLRARSLRELAATVGYLESVVLKQRRAVERFVALRSQTEELQVGVEAKKDAAKAQRDVVVERLSALQGVRAEYDAVRDEALAEEHHQQQLVDEVRARRAEFEAEIQALRAESGSLTAFLRGIQPQGRPASGRGVLAPPLPGGVLTSGFGPRLHPVLGTVRTHDGLDYAAPSGTPIRTAAAGTVVFSGPRGGYGNTVVVDHGGSLATVYAHQSDVYVTAGTPVTAGQVIGAVGSTGLSTGPHLHFEARVHGVPVDPLGYL